MPVIDSAAWLALTTVMVGCGAGMLVSVPPGPFDWVVNTYVPAAGAVITLARVLPHRTRKVLPAAQVTSIVIVHGPEPLTAICGVPAVGNVHVGVVRAGVVGLMARTPGESAIVGGVQPAGTRIVTWEPAAMFAVAVKLKSTSSRDMPGVTVGSP